MSAGDTQAASNRPPRARPQVVRVLLALPPGDRRRVVIGHVVDDRDVDLRALAEVVDRAPENTDLQADLALVIRYGAEVAHRLVRAPGLVRALHNGRERPERRRAEELAARDELVPVGLGRSQLQIVRAAVEVALLGKQQR
jgi:hypothetical protein